MPAGATGAGATGPARAAATARAHVFVADPERPVLDPPDRHHLERVLRLRPGDEITVADGTGRWRRCRLGPGGDLDPVTAVEAEPEPAVPVGVAFALTKGGRPEWAVQKLTELGVDRIVAFRAERSVVRWTPEQAAGHTRRWRRIVREAASQSRRAWLPVVEEVADFADVLGRPGAVLADRDGDPPAAGPVLALVGPEGGWSDAERAAAGAAALPRLGLGPHVLRAETAAVAAAAVLGALRAGLVAPP